MSAGVQVRRVVSSALARLGPESRVSRAIVRRTCGHRGVDCEFESNWVALRSGGTEIRLHPDQVLFAPYISSHFETFAASVDGADGPIGRVVDFSVPALHRYRSLDAEFELPAFPEAIDFEEEYFRFGRPATGSLVFDLGANVGLVTHALSHAVGSTGRVVAFEPDPTSLEYLRRNNARHKLGNVDVVTTAIAGQAGHFEFYAEGSITSGLAQTRRDAVMTSSLGSVITCEAITLADAFAKNGTPAWIKMDIEGAEIEVLEGSRDLLRDTRPFLVIDTSHVVGSDTSARRVEQILRSVGYAVETRTPGGSQLTWAAHGGFGG